MASISETSGDGLAALLVPTMPNLQDSDMIPQPMDGSMSLSAADQVSFNLNQFDMNGLRSENKILKSKIKQLQSDLLTEQDIVASVRKKLNTSERDRIDAVAKANEEASRLDSEVTKARAQLEKGEAVRQTLEYELSKARRDVHKEKRNVSERDSLLTEVNSAMKQRVDELTKQVESLCDELESNKLKHNDDLRRLKLDMEDKDSEMGKMKADIDGVENEKVKLENALTQSDDTIRELEERLQELDEEKRLQTDELRRQITELDLIREQQTSIKKDYEVASNRVKSLEESIEAERAAHLESKFNSEIIQLRLRDLENALDLEKSTKIEAFASSEKLNRQLRDLQHIYDEERKLSLETKEKLEKAEKEYAALSRQLNKELEEKRTVISNLSKQMEEHQKNFTELKQELAKAKRKQLTVEETYSGCMKELDLLHDNFKLDQSGKKPTTRRKVGEKKGGPGKPPQPNVVMDNLRHLLIEYSQKLDDTAAQLKKEKSEHEAVEKDCKKQKDMVYAKDKALQTAQNGMTRTTKDIRQLQTENKGLDKAVKQLTEDLDLLHKQVQKEKKQNMELAQQCAALITTTKAEEKKTSEFMYHLYHQLSVDVSHTEKRDIQRCTFEDAANTINDQTSRVLNNSRWMTEKIKHLEATLVNKEDLVQQMQRAHDEQLSKLASMAEGRSQQWVQQKADMESHYSKLLEEIHSRHKKTQTMADQAWEKVRSTGNVQQSLEKECEMLRQQLLLSQDQGHSLQAACALLYGAVYPLYQRNQALATQRGILQEQADRFELFKNEVKKLVEALSLDNISSSTNTTTNTKKGGKDSTMSHLKLREKTPLLRFRAGAVAVIAAHRLVKIPKEAQRKMFVARDTVPGIPATVVYSGEVDDDQRKYSGVSDKSSGRTSVVEWLSSNTLMSVISASMADVVPALQKTNNGERGYDQNKLVNTLRAGFQKLIFHLPNTFPSASMDNASGLRERGSLLRFLGHGLNCALSRCSSADGRGGSLPSIESSPRILSALQKHMLDFTQRLHTAEVERRDLRVQVNMLHQDTKHHTDRSIEAERMVKELHFLRQQVENTVERGRFDEMCQELNRALQREQEAQLLLNEQSQQIRELGMRLDLHVSKGSEKEHTISEAVQGLSEAKMEVKRQEQRVRQLTRQAAQMEGENGRLQENVRDAESALRTTAKDREALMVYIKTVEKILEQVTSQSSLHGPTSACPDLSRLVSADLVPANLSKIGPELVACQSLVAGFVDSQKQLSGQMTVLQGEIEQHKKHITTLKREISAACRREYQDEFEKIRDGGAEEPLSPSRPVIGNSVTGQRRFAPLEEDLNDVYGLPSPTSPKSRQVPKTNQSRYQGAPTKRGDMKRRPAEGGERR